MDIENDALTHKIIGCCYEVHKELGPGFLEKIYANALTIQFLNQNIKFENEKAFDVYFKDKIIGKFRCDFFVEDKVIVELKSVTGIMPKLFYSQLLSYLKASKIKTGLLINLGNGSC